LKRLQVAATEISASKDLEDLIAVIDGRSELVEEVRAADGDVRGYLAKEIKQLISISAFRDALPGHVRWVVPQRFVLSAECLPHRVTFSSRATSGHSTAG
jgi:hypothetical protein